MIGQPSTLRIHVVGNDRNGELDRLGGRQRTDQRDIREAALGLPVSDACLVKGTIGIGSRLRDRDVPVAGEFVLQRDGQPRVTGSSRRLTHGLGDAEEHRPDVFQRVLIRGLGRRSDRGRQCRSVLGHRLWRRLRRIQRQHRRERRDRPNTLERTRQALHLASRTSCVRKAPAPPGSFADRKACDRRNVES